MNFTKEDLEKAYKEGWNVGYANGATFRPNNSGSDKLWQEYWNSIKPLEPGYYWANVSVVSLTSPVIIRLDCNRIWRHENGIILPDNMQLLSKEPIAYNP